MSDSDNSDIDPDNIYLEADYDQRMEVKRLGARWDKDRKRWFAPPGADREALAPWMRKRVYISVDYSEKDEAKEQGARWDARKYKWFYYEDMDSTKFDRWTSCVGEALD